MNVIARLEFELAYYNSAVKHFNHYTTQTSAGFLYFCSIAWCNDTHTYTRENIVNTIMTSEHTSLEKYTSHTLFDMVEKGLCVRGELEKDCNILTRSSSVFNSSSFSFCCSVQPGTPRVQPSAKSWFSLPRTATTDSKLTELPLAPGYIIVWSTPASCERRICTQFNPSTVKVRPWYLRPDIPVPWSTAWSEVNMLHFIWLANK